VIAHQAVGKHLRVMSRHGRTKDLQHAAPVVDIDEDLRAPVAARSGVIGGSRKLDTQWSAHRERLPAES